MDLADYRTHVGEHLKLVLMAAGLDDRVALRVASSGRKNRALLVLLLAESTINTRDSALTVASGLELIHKASVIRDDIQDDDSIRRGRATEHQILGFDAALALSDVCLAIGMSQASVNAKFGKRVNAVLYRMAAGQYKDICGRQSELANDPYHIAAEKTGSLIGLCFELGGTLAGRSKKDVGKLSDIGLALGTAFQLSNDIADCLTGYEGRPPGTDQRLGRRGSISLIMEKGISREEAIGLVQSKITHLEQFAQAATKRLNRRLPESIEHLILHSVAARDFVADQKDVP